MNVLIGAMFQPTTEPRALMIAKIALLVMLVLLCIYIVASAMMGVPDTIAATTVVENAPDIFAQFESGELTYKSTFP